MDYSIASAQGESAQRRFVIMFQPEWKEEAKPKKRPVHVDPNMPDAPSTLEPETWHDYATVLAAIKHKATLPAYRAGRLFPAHVMPYGAQALDLDPAKGNQEQVDEARAIAERFAPFAKVTESINGGYHIEFECWLPLPELVTMTGLRIDIKRGEGFNGATPSFLSVGTAPSFAPDVDPAHGELKRLNDDGWRVLRELYASNGQPLDADEQPAPGDPTPTRTRKVKADDLPEMPDRGAEFDPVIVAELDDAARRRLADSFDNTIDKAGVYSTAKDASQQCAMLLRDILKKYPNRAAAVRIVLSHPAGQQKPASHAKDSPKKWANYLHRQANYEHENNHKDGAYMKVNLNLPDVSNVTTLAAVQTEQDDDFTFQRDEVKPPEKPASFTVERFLPVGVTIFYGDSQTFKSFLLQHICGCVAIGTGYLSTMRVVGGIAVYLVGEAPETELPRRAAWNAIYNDGEAIPRYYTWTPKEAPNLLNDSVVNRTISQLEKLVNSTGEPLRVLAIDTLTDVMHEDANDNKVMAALMRQLGRIARHFNCSIALTHHTGKNAEAGHRGGKSLKDKADAFYKVERVEMPDPKNLNAIDYRCKVTNEKLKSGKPKQVFTFPLILADVPEWAQAKQDESGAMQYTTIEDSFIKKLREQNEEDSKLTLVMKNMTLEDEQELRALRGDATPEEIASITRRITGKDERWKFFPDAVLAHINDCVPEFKTVADITASLTDWANIHDYQNKSLGNAGSVSKALQRLTKRGLIEQTGTAPRCMYKSLK